MNYKEYKYLVLSDLYRYGAAKGLKSLLNLLLRGEGFKYSFWMRTAKYTRTHKWMKYSIYPIVRFLLLHYTYKFSISIPENTKIGSGFYIGHFGTIVVNPNTIIVKIVIFHRASR